MTKTINKKIVAFLMVILCSFCMITIPVYADNVNANPVTTNGVSLVYLGNDDALQTRSINSLLLKSLIVYPAKYVDGQYYADPDWYAYAVGPTYPILNCNVPSDMSQEMVELNFNYFFNHLDFSVEGTGLRRVVLKVDGEVVIDDSLTRTGNYYIEWATSKKNSDYELIIYSSNTNAAAWGHITVER